MAEWPRTRLQSELPRFDSGSRLSRKMNRTGAPGPAGNRVGRFGGWASSAPSSAHGESTGEVPGPAANRDGRSRGWASSARLSAHHPILYRMVRLPHAIDLEHDDDQMSKCPSRRAGPVSETMKFRRPKKLRPTRRIFVPGRRKLWAMARLCTCRPLAMVPWRQYDVAYCVWTGAGAAASDAAAARAVRIGLTSY